jgi:hypothetical protein
MDAIDNAFLGEAVMQADNELVEEIHRKLTEQGIESVFNKEDSSLIFLDSTITYGVLRIYSWLKYADAEEGDWFHYYMWCVRRRVESVFTLFKDPQLDHSFRMNSFLYQSWDALIANIRPKLLETPRQQKWLTEELTLRESDAQNATPEI